MSSQNPKGKVRKLDQNLRQKSIQKPTNVLDSKYGCKSTIEGQNQARS